jgi:hypothetical protein
MLWNVSVCRAQTRVFDVLKGLCVRAVFDWFKGMCYGMYLYARHGRHDTLGNSQWFKGMFTCTRLIQGNWFLYSTDLRGCIFECVYMHGRYVCRAWTSRHSWKHEMETRNDLRQCLPVFACFAVWFKGMHHGFLCFVWFKGRYLYAGHGQHGTLGGAGNSQWFKGIYTWFRLMQGNLVWDGFPLLDWFKGLYYWNVSVCRARTWRRRWWG